MKWNSFLLAAIAAPALALSLSGAARAQDASAPACINDIDCTGSGTACGTEVCNWNMGKICVPAANAAMQDTWCGGDYSTTYDQATADMECKCHAEGATCMNFHCTIWTVDAGSTSDAGSGAAAPEAAGGSSGGCSVARGSEPRSVAFGALCALGFASGIAASRRRKRSPATTR